LVERLSAHLAEDVPEGDVDRRVAALLDARARRAQVAAERGCVPLDLERILAEQVGRNGLVQVGIDSLGAEERLSEAEVPFVCPHRDEEEIGELLEAEGVELRDLHLREDRDGRRREGAPAAAWPWAARGTASRA
jgi:hypothetical protein